MPSIDDILKNLEGEAEQQKTASANISVADAETERQARELGLLEPSVKTASQQMGGNLNMNLQEFYDTHFTVSEKTASAVGTKQNSEELSKEASAQLESIGEKAGISFSEGLNDRLLQFTIKVAMDGLPDSEATKAIQAGAGVIPGAQVANPQLDVNKGDADDMGMVTNDPEYYSLLSKAVAKAKIKADIASGNPSETSYQVSQANSGLATGGSQKDA